MDGPKSLFRDRDHAGIQLGKLLKQRSFPRDSAVLGLPRGGVVVAFHVAEILDLDFDIFNVRKVGVPGHDELAMGAVAGGDILVLDEDLVGRLQIPEPLLNAVIEDEKQEIERREDLYRRDFPEIDVRRRTVIVVDDGLATGATMLAAVRALRAKEPRQLVVAVPVGARETCTVVKSEADELICMAAPPDFNAVGQWYEFFPQTTDLEVIHLLEKAHNRKLPR